LATKAEKLAVGGVVTTIAAAGAAWLVIINVFEAYHKNFVTKDEVIIMMLERENGE
jgi:hypothetical protein